MAVNTAVLLSVFIPGKKGLYVSQQRPKSPIGYIVLMGLEAKAPCDHRSCAFQTWCNETGACSHDCCLTEQVCKLPRLRAGAHCGHSECPSLLRCQRSHLSTPEARPCSSSSEDIVKSSKGSSSVRESPQSSQVFGSVSDKDILRGIVSRRLVVHVG
jgi:hypothetical protein